MIPDHARKRLDAFARTLRNAGLAENAVSRIHEVAAAYETEHGAPPLSSDEIRSYVKAKPLPGEREQRQTEAFLGAYLIFNSPSMGMDVSALIHGMLSIEPDSVIRTAQKALEGEGPLGRFATRTMSFFARETVRQWLAPIGAVALVVLAFLENPAFIFMRMMHPSPTKAVRELDMSSSAVESAQREAALARDLMQVVARRWKGGATPTLGELAALSASPADFDPLVRAYDLDASLWPSRGDLAPPDVVLRAKGATKRIVLAGRDAVTVIDPKFVITAEGYR